MPQEKEFEIFLDSWNEIEISIKFRINSEIVYELSNFYLNKTIVSNQDNCRMLR